jgi:hypothetical protein
MRGLVCASGGGRRGRLDLRGSAVKWVWTVIPSLHATDVTPVRLPTSSATSTVDTHRAASLRYGVLCGAERKAVTSSWGTASVRPSATSNLPVTGL